MFILRLRANPSRITTEASFHGAVIALFLKARGPHVLVGDLMRSISVLVQKQEGGAFELVCLNKLLILQCNNSKTVQVAQDANPNWMTAIEIVDDETFIGAESSSNLFVCKRSFDQTAESNNLKMDLIGEYHLGESVNVLRPGSLAMHLKDGESSVGDQQSILYGAVSGAIGTLLQLTPDEHEFVLQLQEKLNKVVHGVGGLSHTQWRAFRNERRPITEASYAQNFIDGDLIESFLNLTPEKMTEVRQSVFALSVKAD